MIQKILVLFGLLLSNILFVTNSVASVSEAQLLRRVNLLERALAPTNPRAVAQMWAEAIKNRNGAVEYMLLCPPLQKTNLANLKALNWVTGVSSPWISDYKIMPQEKKENSFKFAIQYKFSAGGGKNWTATDDINVVHVKNEDESSQQWCINHFNYLSPVDALQNL